MDRAQWGILSPFPTVTDGAGMSKMTSSRVFLVPWTGACSPIYFGAVNLNGWTDEGGKREQRATCQALLGAFQVLKLS